MWAAANSDQESQWEAHGIQGGVEQLCQRQGPASPALGSRNSWTSKVGDHFTMLFQRGIPRRERGIGLAGSGGISG